MSSRKTSRFPIRRSAIVAAMALAFTLDANANLIVDGGFEGNGNLTPNNASYNNGETGIPSWTVVASDAYRNVQ